MVFGESSLKDVWRRAVWGPWRRALEAAPPAVEVHASRALGRAAALGLRARRRLLRDTLREALGERPDLDELVAAAFATHFANQYVGFGFHKLRPETLGAYLRLRGREHLDRARARGRGVVVAHPHLGLPQLPLHALGVLGYPMHQIGGGRPAVVLSAEGERAAAIRASLEGRIAATLHDGHRYLRPVLRALAAGEIVFTACDGTGGGEELGRRRPLPVLGRPMLLPVLPVWLAERTGAALLTCACWRADGPRPALEAEIGEEIAGDEGERLAGIARRLEGWLRDHPGDWHFWDAWHDRQGGLLERTWTTATTSFSARSGP